MRAEGSIAPSPERRSRNYLLCLPSGAPLPRPASVRLVLLGL